MEDRRISPPCAGQTVWRRDCVASHANGREGPGPAPEFETAGFLRQLVRAVLPLGEGIVIDTFAGAGSTLAAAEAVGYASIGIEKDKEYYEMACQAIPVLAELRIANADQTR